MTPKCDRIVEEMDQLLKDPSKTFAWAAREIYDEGYIVGMEMQRRLTRLSLGLAVPADLED
jgi:hypothetical protein